MPGRRSGCAGGEDGAGERCAAAGGDSSPSCSLRAPRCRRRRAGEQGPSSGPPAPPPARSLRGRILPGPWAEPRGAPEALRSSGAVPLLPLGAAALQTSTLASEPVWPAGKSWEAFSPCPWDCPAAGTEPQGGAGAGGSGCPPQSPQSTAGPPPHVHQPWGRRSRCSGDSSASRRVPSTSRGRRSSSRAAQTLFGARHRFWLRAPGTARTPQGQKGQKAPPRRGCSGAGEGWRISSPASPTCRARAAPRSSCVTQRRQDGALGPAAHALTQKVPAAAGGRSRLFSQREGRRDRIKGLRMHKAGSHVPRRALPLSSPGRTSRAAAGAELGELRGEGSGPRDKAARSLGQEQPKAQQCAKHGLCCSSSPCNLRYLLSLHLLARAASPRWDQHRELPAAKGKPDKGERGGRKAAGRPGPAALGGLRNLGQLQPVPVAARPCAAGVPSLAHSSRRALHRPGPSGLRHTCPVRTWQPDPAAGGTRVPSRERAGRSQGRSPRTGAGGQHRGPGTADARHGLEGARCCCCPCLLQRATRGMGRATRGKNQG